MTDLANDLAKERTYLAAERTLMGWIRTAISMITFGFTIGKLGQVLDDIQVQSVLRVRTLSVKGVAHFLVIVGTAALALACLQHRQQVRKLRGMGLPRQVSLTLWVAILLLVMGASAFISLVSAL